MATYAQCVMQELRWVFHHQHVDNSESVKSIGLPLYRE